jgi:hypothetical protein
MVNREEATAAGSDSVSKKYTVKSKLGETRTGITASDQDAVT